jgi:hypothetical protein
VHRRTFIGTCASFALGGCARTATNARFEDVAIGGDPLRTTFNRDAGKVRIVMLVSPT